MNVKRNQDYIIFDKRSSSLSGDLLLLAGPLVLLLRLLLLNRPMKWTFSR